MWDSNSQVHKYHLQDVERAFARATGGNQATSGTSRFSANSAIRLRASEGVRVVVTVAVTIVFAGFFLGL